LHISPAALDTLHDHGSEGKCDVISSQYFPKMLELYEIANHTMLSQLSACTSFSDRLGLPRLYQNEDDDTIAMKLDVCLRNWEKSLPPSLKFDAAESSEYGILERQRVMCRLR
jgi:hypothetical protein